jgi:hypothetical protein
MDHADEGDDEGPLLPPDDDDGGYRNTVVL